MIAIASEAFGWSSGIGGGGGSSALELPLGASRLVVLRPVDGIDLLLFRQAALFSHFVVSVNGG